MDSYSRETDPYIVDTDSHYIDVSGGHCGGTVDLSITVTAAFPDDNSGDENGDGWDDVCYEAGAESGDENLDGDLNVLDIVIYSNYILYP